MMPLSAVATASRPRAGRGYARPFATAAGRYWFGVFPAARSAQRRLRARAEKIPDPILRADALASHHDKRSNSEGLAAFAVLAPPSHRAALARSLVAYQLMLDYLDGVSERPSNDPLANGLRLHRAFEVALDPAAPHLDYYAAAPAGSDGGYLTELIETCRGPLRSLPAFDAVQESLLRQARLCRESQALNHAMHFETIEERLDLWAAQTALDARLGPGFEWWELIAAAAASSLCIGALLALGACPGASKADARQVEAAYFPWASGLNALLDSLIDLDEDLEGSSHLRRYSSGEEATQRLQIIAVGARERVSALPDGALHEAVLAAMGALYLTDEKAWRPDREQMSLAVYRALGTLVGPALVVHLLRRRGRGARTLLAARQRWRARL